MVYLLFFLQSQRCSNFGLMDCTPTVEISSYVLMNVHWTSYSSILSTFKFLLSRNVPYIRHWDKWFAPFHSLLNHDSFLASTYVCCKSITEDCSWLISILICNIVTLNLHFLPYQGNLLLWQSAYILPLCQICKLDHFFAFVSWMLSKIDYGSYNARLWQSSTLYKFFLFNDDLPLIFLSEYTWHIDPNWSDKIRLKRKTYSKTFT